MYDLITSPFYIKHGTGKVDQGVITYAENSRSEFVYGKHYDETKTLIAGLKAAASKVYAVSTEDFAAFNIKTDYASKELLQEVSTTNVKLTFRTSSGAIGFAIDCGGYLVVYVTADATFAVTEGTVTSVEAGSFDGDDFVASETLTASETISLVNGKLYRIGYDSVQKISSTTWQEIGG